MSHSTDIDEGHIKTMEYDVIDGTHLFFNLTHSLLSLRVPKGQATGKEFMRKTHLDRVYR